MFTFKRFQRVLVLWKSVITFRGIIAVIHPVSDAVYSTTVLGSRGTNNQWEDNYEFCLM